VYLQPKEIGHVAKQHVGNVTQLIVAQTPGKKINILYNEYGNGKGTFFLS
jgi:hypothetical protein